MQPSNTTHRNSDVPTATFHSMDNFCIDPYALAAICQANATQVIGLN